jgi:SAM-dependent methyltransferase
MSDFTYVGEELDLFAQARNWKRYWSDQVRPFVTGDVLEVGAGIGTNTRLLDTPGAKRWTCLEPDQRLYDRLLHSLPADGRYTARRGTLALLDPLETFDTIIYIDVLEHIENDRHELADAAAHLKPGGRIVVLAPAHQRLFTEFDRGVGHFRRYNRSMLKSISPPATQLERLFYLDSVGLLASAANLLLRRKLPSAGQLQLWDSYLVRASTYTDPVIGRAIGKTIVGVWRKPD